VLTLADPLEHARRLHAQRLAIVDGDRRFTFAQLHERCGRLGAALLQLGLREGERVAFLAANSHRYLEAFYAIPAHGLVFVPLNTRLAPAELSAILQDCGARFLFSDRDPGPLAQHVERVFDLERDYEALLAAAEPVARPLVDEHALATLFYTGGTTGTPKGVMLTHRNLIANSFHKTIACSLSADDIYLAAPALFPVAGIAPLVGLTWLGASTVVLPSFDPDRCLEAIEQHGATIAIPVPTMVAAMVAAQRKQPRRVDSLRMMGHAGSPIASEAIAAAHAAFPRAELAQFYGATETASVVTALRDEQKLIGTELLGSCGRAVPGVAVRTLKADGSECAPGEVGEITVRGPNVSVGYFRNESATLAAHSGGWYRTGDVGVLREDGHLFIVDRIKDMIVSGGENVYSIEVEDVLYRHPAVLEAAVFGVPDAHWGEAVHAVVVVRSDFARDDALAGALKDHCRRSIAGYKVPKAFDIQLEPLPKSGPGKILKRAIRERFWQAKPKTDDNTGRL
jgi:long-chain acyl-CoA synthetase